MPSKYVHLILISLLFALPVIFLPGIYHAFEMPKVLLLYLLSTLLIYFLSRSGYRINFKKIHIFFVLFLGWIILTSFLGLSFEQSFWGSYFRMQGIISWLCYILLFFVSGKLFENNHFKKQANWAILCASTFCSMLALSQFISYWFLGNTTQLLYSNRVISTFGQPNFLGAFLTLSLPFVWYLYKHTNHTQSSRAQFLSGMAIFIIILGIFSTFSRSAYLALLILALIWGFYHRRLLLLGIAVSILIFVFLGNLFPDLVFTEWSRFKVDTFSEWTAENRLLIAQKSLKLIEQKPIIGYGLENFSLAFPTVITPLDLGLKDIVVDSSHNLFLDIAVQTGLVGLILFLVILILIIKKGLKGDNFTKTCLCVVIAFIVVHQFSPYSVVPMVLFWVSLGIINGSPIEHLSIEKRFKSIVNIIFIPILLFTILFIVQTLRADSLFYQSSAYEVSDIKRAIQLDNEAISLAPWITFYKARRDFLYKQLGISN